MNVITRLWPYSVLNPVSNGLESEERRMSQHNGPAHHAPKQPVNQWKKDSRPVQSTSIYFVFPLLKFPDLVTSVDFLPAEGTNGVSLGHKTA